MAGFIEGMKTDDLTREVYVIDKTTVFFKEKNALMMKCIRGFVNEFWCLYRLMVC